MKISDDKNTTTTARLPAWAAGIGGAGGLLAVGYYLLLQGALRAVWDGLLDIRPLSLPVEPTWQPGIIAVTTTGGLIVGLLTRWLGSAGEIAAVVDNIHLDHGRIDIRQTPSMTLTSLASIASGGSAGPEAPLVQIIGDERLHEDRLISHFLLTDRRQPAAEMIGQAFADLFFVACDGVCPACDEVPGVHGVPGTNDDVGLRCVLANMFKNRNRGSVMRNGNDDGLTFPKTGVFQHFTLCGITNLAVKPDLCGAANSVLVQVDHCDANAFVHKQA